MNQPRRDQPERTKERRPNRFRRTPTRTLVFPGAEGSILGDKSRIDTPEQANAVIDAFLGRRPQGNQARRVSVARPALC